MDEATVSADLIRRDILDLSSRHLYVDAFSSRCCSCSRSILQTAPKSVIAQFGCGLGREVGGETFFGFPCGMVRKL